MPRWVEPTIFFACYACVVVGASCVRWEAGLIAFGVIPVTAIVWGIHK